MPGKSVDDTVDEVRQTAVEVITEVVHKLGKRKRDESEALRNNAKRRKEQDDDLASQVPSRTPATTDSRGREIPATVQRLPSGKLPSNWHYAGKLYDGDRWTPELKKKYPDGVRFTKDGFPDFTPYADRTTKIDGGFVGRTSDFAVADKAAGISASYRRDHELTWHHHQDGTTLQLVPRDMHDAVRHAGGIAIAAKGHSK